MFNFPLFFNIFNLHMCKKNFLIYICYFFKINLLLFQLNYIFVPEQEKKHTAFQILFNNKNF